MYLRDVLEDLSRRKLRDLVDFEWKRNIRFYGTDNSRAPGECHSDLLGLFVKLLAVKMVPLYSLWIDTELVFVCTCTLQEARIIFGWPCKLA